MTVYFRHVALLGPDALKPSNGTVVQVPPGVVSLLTYCDLRVQNEEDVVDGAMRTAAFLKIVSETLAFLFYTSKSYDHLNHNSLLALVALCGAAGRGYDIGWSDKEEV